MGKLILGLDISSVKTGYAIIDSHKGILEAGFCKLSKSEKPSQVLYLFMVELFKNYNIQEVVIEDIFLGQNPKSFKVLAGLHGVIRLGLDLLDITPEYINATAARKKILGDGASKKEMVYEQLQKLYPNDNLKTAGFDVSDALLIALSWSGFDLEPSLQKELLELININKNKG
jgi:crossover junction endodeoxyribonuclease RuvC